MYYGVDYYPEQWPENEWEKDAQLMSQANINIVRMAEFAWSKIESKEGEFNFEWLDKVINILANYGIKVILGTPTATPPKWLIDKHPDILPIDYNGNKLGFGSRRHYCPNNKTYHEYTIKIVKTIAEHYKDNENVLYWQIDNEFGCHRADCHCDNCLEAFKKWLKSKYITIENLNNAWGTIFWSQTYPAWESIIIPKITLTSHNPSLLLDYKRFMSDSFVKYQKIQIDTIKDIIPNAQITHNFMGLFNQIDYYNLAKDLDFVSWDNYPVPHFGNYSFRIKNTAERVALSHDVMRGLKRKNYWVMEHQSGPTGGEEVGRQLVPGEIRLWTYQSIAHGADSIVYFRWRTASAGSEEYWHGILDHDGIPRRRYEEIKLIGKEVKKIQNIIEGSKVNAEIAILRSFDNEWAFEIQPHKNNFKYINQLNNYYKYFYEKNMSVDIVDPLTNLDKYKLVIAPGLIMLNKQILENISLYLQKGGRFLTTFRAGSKNWENRMNTNSLVGPLKDILGIDIEEYGAIPDGEDFLIKIDDDFGEANTWYDVIKPINAKILGLYDSGYITGKPFFTVNYLQNGKAYYVGTIPEEKMLRKILNVVLEDISIQPYPFKVDQSVEISERIKNGKSFYFILNFNDVESHIIVNRPMIDILNDEIIKDSISIKPLEVKILSHT